MFMRFKKPQSPLPATPAPVAAPDETLAYYVPDTASKSAGAPSPLDQMYEYYSYDPA